MSDWQNRIKGLDKKPASQFTAHPLNWRKHPMRQRKAVKGSLDSLGWVDVVIENVTTGNVIDGHERIWNALQNGDADVPYIQVELTVEEEAQALLSLDSIAALAQTDADKVDELLRMVNTDNENVMEFLTDFASENGITAGADGFDFGGLPDEDRAPFRQMTFTLHDEQAEQVFEALKLAKSKGAFDTENENSNGNALARICETYITNDIG